MIVVLDRDFRCHMANQVTYFMRRMMKGESLRGNSTTASVLT
jgi:hypothetical protein